MTTPGTASPTNAMLIAMRWSLYVSISAPCDTAGRDPQSVGTLLDFRAQLAQFDGQGVNAVGLFVADVGDAA